MCFINALALVYANRIAFGARREVKMRTEFDGLSAGKPCNTVKCNFCTVRHSALVKHRGTFVAGRSMPDGDGRCREEYPVRREEEEVPGHPGFVKEHAVVCRRKSKKWGVFFTERVSELLL